MVLPAEPSYYKNDNHLNGRASLHCLSKMHCLNPRWSRAVGLLIGLIAGFCDGTVSREYAVEL